MDFEYRYNSSGQPVAEFSMGHEAIGRWITDELGASFPKIEQLLAIIEQIESGALVEKSIIGIDLKLSLNYEDVEVNALFDSDEELPEETNLSEDESYACCGLPDFKQAVEEWLSFHQ
jgi:uncharacterized protein YacL (UPF0231 family)